MAARKTWESALKPGDKAPAFTAVLQDGSEITDQTFTGQRTILFFYPKDNTPTCTTEACNLRDAYGELQEKGFQVVGVSRDSQRSHQNFIQKQNLPYPLISDPDNSLAKAFDVFGEKKFMGRVSQSVHRTTFVIDGKGKIEAVIHPVNAKDHANQILQAVDVEA